jgi:uncharacterized protein
MPPWRPRSWRYNKVRLEDIYLPFKPKRRTKAEIAKEAGLAPLATLLLSEPQTDPQSAASSYVNADKQVADVAAALDGARAILVERFAEEADLIGTLREAFWTQGRLVSKLLDGKAEAGAKFADYFEYAEVDRYNAAIESLVIPRPMQIRRFANRL